MTMPSDMTTPSDGRRTILVVDDDVGIRESLQDVLTDEGYHVELAGDGLEALELLRARRPPPCVILLDWMMPRCDGATFRQAQLADPALRDVPVILLTADVRLRDKLSTLSTMQSLTKPVDLPRMLSLLASYCTT